MTLMDWAKLITGKTIGADEDLYREDLAKGEFSPWNTTGIMKYTPKSMDLRNVDPFSIIQNGVPATQSLLFDSDHPENNSSNGYARAYYAGITIPNVASGSTPAGFTSHAKDPSYAGWFDETYGVGERSDAELDRDLRSRLPKEYQPTRYTSFWETEKKKRGLTAEPSSKYPGLTYKSYLSVPTPGARDVVKIK